MRGRRETPIRLARGLRVNQTNAETALWNRIRNRQVDGTNLRGRSRSGATSATLCAASGRSSSRWAAASTQNLPPIRSAIAF
ncbi:DUF559 domain-containing protein [Bradyrhizobium sp. BR2003]|uniref:DUF559 domain-containing protein n=1 Tax=Bradyrhizobium sp. BR2003 TaxID=1419258 RepID=UPI0032E0036C